MIGTSSTDMSIREFNESLVDNYSNPDEVTYEFMGSKITQLGSKLTTENPGVVQWICPEFYPKTTEYGYKLRYLPTKDELKLFLQSIDLIYNIILMQ